MPDVIASKWSAEEYNKTHHRLAKTIQEAWRDRGKPKKKKKNTFRWPTLFELKALYLDADAVAAGAEGSEFYSDDALKAREKLRSDPVVVGALEEAWAALVPEGSEGMDQQMYWDTFRKLYLYMTLGEVPDPHDCFQSVGKDWLEDSQGDGVLDFDEFSKSWFQLADLNTEGIAHDIYAGWVGQATDMITAPPEPGGRTRQLRKSRELLELSLNAAGIEDVDERERKSARCAAAG